MRTVVALVEARPDTVNEDYRRVLNLAGLSGVLGGEPPRVLIAAGDSGFVPGWGATPWQLAETLAWLGEQTRPVPVSAVSGRGAGPVPRKVWWLDCMARHLAQGAGPEFLRVHRHVSRLLHPALDAVLPEGVQVPVGLTEGPALLLTAPALSPGWGVAGGAALLQSLVARGAKPSRRAPAAEVAAEAVGVARELMPEMGVVLDGTLWGVAEGPRGSPCVARNVLLAGTDPVAVDTVAMRLAGVDPRRVPWLRICADRGFGQASPTDIRVVGRTDLLDLDFGLSDLDLDPRRGPFGADGGGPVLSLLGPAARLLRRRGRQTAPAALSGTIWKRLYEEYATGQQAGVAGA